MFVKKFQSFDQMYYKKVNAYSIIMAPEEKESFEAAMKKFKGVSTTAEKFLKFLRPYKPYTDEEKEAYPDGAFNTVIFEDNIRELIGDFAETLMFLNNVLTGSSKT